MIASTFAPTVTVGSKSLSTFLIEANDHDVGVPDVDSTLMLIPFSFAAAKMSF